MSQNNSRDWKTISSNVVFQGKKLTVLHDKVILPNGDHGEYEYIQKQDSILVIPSNETSFILVEQYRYPVRKIMLEFPQGASLQDETDENAAKRELEEETGLKAGNIQPLGRIEMGKGSTSQRCSVFLAQELTPGKRKLDKTEQDLIVKEILKSEMKSHIFNGSISDSATLAAYSLLVSKW